MIRTGPMNPPIFLLNLPKQKAYNRLEEEQVMDARISMAFNGEGNICAVQKGGSGYFTPQQILEASKIAQEKAAELRKTLKW